MLYRSSEIDKERIREEIFNIYGNIFFLIAHTLFPFKTKTLILLVNIQGGQYAAKNCTIKNTYFLVFDLNFQQSPLKTWVFRF